MHKRQNRQANRKAQRMRQRRHKLAILMTIPTTPEPSTIVPSLFNLNSMVIACRNNWSNWLAQVTAARMEQVTKLSQTPSIKQIELLLDLEKLGNQLEQVWFLFIFNAYMSIYLYIYCLVGDLFPTRKDIQCGRAS